MVEISYPHILDSRGTNYAFSCPDGTECSRTVCQPPPKTIFSPSVKTVIPPPTTTTGGDGAIHVYTPPPIVTTASVIVTSTWVSSYIPKNSPTTKLVPSPSFIDQRPPIAQQVSDARKLKGGAIGGIVAGSIVAILVILSAVIFTWRRLSGRGNTDGAGGFGGTKSSGRNRHMATAGGTYNPYLIGGTARRQNDSKFGRSGSGSSGGYRGTTALGANQRNRGSDPFYTPGTTAASSDGGEKSFNSSTLATLQPTTPPGGMSPPGGMPPPIFHEADGTPIQQPAPYADMNPQDAYAMELAGEPQPLPVQRWHVTNPDLESLSSRAPSRVGYGGPVHTGTNF